MKTESLTNPSTLQLSDGEHILKNIPKNILYSEIIYCPKVWINTDDSEVSLEFDPETETETPIPYPGNYSFLIDFKTDFSYCAIEEGESDCLTVSFFLTDDNENHFALDEYIKLPHSKGIDEPPAELFYELFGLSIPESIDSTEAIQSCSGKATLTYVKRDDDLPIFALLANFHLDH